MSLFHKKNRIKNSAVRETLFTALEPRILYDGAMVAATQGEAALQDEGQMFPDARPEALAFALDSRPGDQGDSRESQRAAFQARRLIDSLSRPAPEEGTEIIVKESGEVGYMALSRAGQGMQIRTVEMTSDCIQLVVEDAEDYQCGSLEVTLGDGTALPDWLSVDTDTGTIYGDPPDGLSSMVLRLSAKDEQGGEHATQFTVTIPGGPNSRPRLSGGPYFFGDTPERTDSVGVKVETILGGMSASDNDSDSLGIAVTAARGNGVFQFSTDSTNGIDGTWEAFTDGGPLSAVHALLLSGGTYVRYSPDGGQGGETAEIAFRAWDQTVGQASESTHATDTTQHLDLSAGDDHSAWSAGGAAAQISVLAVNDPPSLAGDPGTLTVIENRASHLDLSPYTLSDPDAGTSDITLSFTASTGTLSAAGSQGVSVNGSGTGTLTLTGTADELNTFLDSADNIAYTGPANVTGIGAATITVAANDLGHTGTGGGIDVIVDTLTLDITADTPPIDIPDPNHPPSLSGGPYIFAGINEDTTGKGVTVAEILSGTTARDKDNDALGIAVTENRARGTWEYSTDSHDGIGGTWQSFDHGGTLSDTNALLLSPATFVRFRPDGGNGELAGFAFRAWDGGSGKASDSTGSAASGNVTGGGSGGSPFSGTGALAQIRVADVNDKPQITSESAVSVAENTPADTVVYTATAADVDQGQTHTYGLSGRDAAFFSIDPSRGEVRWLASPDHEAKDTYLFNVHVRDNGTDALTDTQAVTLTVTDVNESPALESPISDQTFAGPGNWVFVVPKETFFDTDKGTDLTLSTAFLPDWLSFDPSTGTFKGTPPRDTGSVPLTVIATDGGGLSVSDTFTLTCLTGDPGDPVPPSNPKIPPMVNESGSRSDPPPGFRLPGQNPGNTPFGGEIFTGESGEAETAGGGDGRKNDPGSPAGSGPGQYVVRVNQEGQVAYLDRTDGQGAVRIAELSGDMVQVVVEMAADAQPGSLEVTLADGSELPAWVSVDPDTGTIFGNPPQGQGSLVLRLTFVNDHGVTHTLVLTVDIPDDSAGAGIQEKPGGTGGLAGQLAAAKDGLTGYGSRIQAALADDKR